MRSVNSNLIDINKAKGRINEAKKNNEQPSQADLDLVATEKQMAFAVAQYADVMNIEKLAKHISSHGCVYSRADVSAILNLTMDCVHEQLLEGKKIRLGELGDFSLNIQSKGAETAEKFSAANITAVNVVWDCGAAFKNLMAEAEFNLVASRKAQQAVIAAIKAGETVVDLAANPEGGDTPDGGGNGGGITPTPKAKYTVTAVSANDAQGSVTGGGTYDEGTEVTLKATAKSGYQFSKWSDGVTTSTRKVTVSGDATFTAEFVEQSNTPPSI